MTIWNLPDWSKVSIPDEERSWAERQAAGDIQNELSSANHAGPLLDDVLVDNASEVRKKAIPYLEGFQRRAVWKDRSQKPEAYAPPTNLGELQARVASAETYFVGCQFTREALVGFPQEVRPNFDDSVFRACDFSNANFEGATFRRARFIECRGFETFSAEGADFEGAEFVGKTNFGANTRLEGASFERTDLKQVIGIIFDRNFVHFTQFPADTSQDAWSNLRRHYNGFTLFFAGLLMAAFLIPLIVRVSALVSYADLVKTGRATWQEVTSSLPPNVAGDINRAVSRKGDALFRCVAEKCDTSPAIKVALDHQGDQFLYRIAALLSLAAFALRYAITSTVASLREHEDRTHYTPAKSEYDWAASMHKVLSLIRLPLFAFYVYVFAAYAWTPIPVLS
jgi:hypothetical protein